MTTRRRLFSITSTDHKVFPVSRQHSRKGPELTRGASVLCGASCWDGPKRVPVQEELEHDLGERLLPNSKGPETRFTRASSNQACRSARSRVPWPDVASRHASPPATRPPSPDGGKQASAELSTQDQQLLAEEQKLAVLVTPERDGQQRVEGRKNEQWAVVEYGGKGGRGKGGEQTLSELS